MQNRITIPHVLATLIGGVAIAYQSAVVWEALDGVSYVTKLGVPLATISAALLPVLGEAAWKQGERAKAMLLCVPVLALIAFVLPSGVSRLGEAQEARRTTASVNKGDLAKATKLVEQATEWVASECRSGNGPKCRGVTYTLEQRQAYLEKLMRPGQPVSPWLPDWHPATLPIGLELAIWACCFYGFGPMARRASQPAVQALTFERPITPKEIDDLKGLLKLTPEVVTKLKASGLKQHEIAAQFNLNQGRVSELMSGKRAEIVLH